MATTQAWQGGVLRAPAQLGSVALQRVDVFVALVWRHPSILAARAFQGDRALLVPHERKLLTWFL